MKSNTKHSTVLSSEEELALICFFPVPRLCSWYLQDTMFMAMQSVTQIAEQLSICAMLRWHLWPSPEWPNDAICTHKEKLFLETHITGKICTFINYTAHDTRCLNANVDGEYWHITFWNTFFYLKKNHVKEKDFSGYSNFSWAFHYHKCNMKNLLLINMKSVCVYNEWKYHLFKTIRKNVSKFSLIH